jgi:hypothetical protein
MSLCLCLCRCDLQAIQAQLNNLAAGLFRASSGVQTVLSAIQEGFPGPMLQSTLDGIRQQVRMRGPALLALAAMHVCAALRTD